MSKTRSGLVVMFLAAIFSLSDTSNATGQETLHPAGRWARASALLSVPGASVAEIVQAARLDLADRRGGAGASALDLARWLRSRMFEPEIDLDGERAAAILSRFMAESGPESATFWSEFSLATFQQLAGDDEAVAETLARALRLAGVENVPSETVARTKGIMGHAEQASGNLDQARQTFESLMADRIERAHASMHLGEIALSTEGVSAGVHVWLDHPDGAAAGVAVIVEEADALWVVDPEQSYRLVAETLSRLDEEAGLASSEGMETAVARLRARSRENVVRP